MLVLTRKQKETIKIGDSITITILRVQGQAVRVGIEAPRDVRVIRGELPPVAVGAGAEESVSSEPQIIEFRFSPEVPTSDMAPRPAARGPLAALMATMHSPGMVSK